jgi:hypothetical protein
MELCGLSQTECKQTVKLLAKLWQDQMKENYGITLQLTEKQLGQMKSLRMFCGKFTQFVLEWMLQPSNWARFSHAVHGQSNQPVPHQPHIGFLLAQRSRALKVMHRQLMTSTAVADMEFVDKIDEWECDRMRDLLKVLGHGQPDFLTEVEDARGIIELNLLFIKGCETLPDLKDVPPAISNDAINCTGVMSGT